jgi:hypothetical protein
MMWREVYWLTLTCSLHHFGTAFLQLFPGARATIPILKKQKTGTFYAK